jgi:hypothetical protein
VTTLKTLRRYLRDWVEDDSIDEIFTNYINLAIQECESFDFHEMSATATVTPTAGIIDDPPRCRKIMDVLPATESGYPSFRFEFRSREVTQDVGGKAFYTFSPYDGYDSNQAEYDVSFVQGGTSLAQEGETFFSQDDVGCRVMLKGADDFYEIVSVSGTAPNQTATVAPAITAEDATEGVAYLTPVGTKRYILKDPSNNVYTAGNVTVCYQKKHPLVWEDDSIVILPCPQTIALLALQQALMTNKYNVDAQRLENAIVFAKNREISSQTIKSTKAQYGDNSFSVRSRR